MSVAGGGGGGGEGGDSFFFLHCFVKKFHILSFHIPISG